MLDAVAMYTMVYLDKKVKFNIKLVHINILVPANYENIHIMKFAVRWSNYVYLSLNFKHKPFGQQYTFCFSIGKVSIKATVSIRANCIHSLLQRK